MNVNTIGFSLAIAALSLIGTPVEASTGLPDLCAELDEYGDPVRCDAVGPGMGLWWDAAVCCDARRCSQPTSTGCPTGTNSYWCERVVLGSRTLQCVYEVPTYCDVYPCGPTQIALPPVENSICCHDEGCYDHEGGLCGGIEVWCGSGVTNEDGTVTCLDGEDE
jgi:hypothetical protein